MAIIARREAAIRLTEYPLHRLALKEPVDWAEQAMKEDEGGRMSPGHPQPSGLGRCEENRFDLGSCEDRLAGLGCRAKVWEVG